MLRQIVGYKSHGGVHLSGKVKSLRVGWKHLKSNADVCPYDDFSKMDGYDQKNSNEIGQKACAKYPTSGHEIIDCMKCPCNTQYGNRMHCKHQAGANDDYPNLSITAHIRINLIEQGRNVWQVKTLKEVEHVICGFGGLQKYLI